MQWNGSVLVAIRPRQLTPRTDPMKSVLDKQRTEIEYWKCSEHESPESNSIYNIINKLSKVLIFLDYLENYKDIFNRSKNILELGGSQG